MQSWLEGVTYPVLTKSVPHPVLAGRVLIQSWPEESWDTLLGRSQWNYYGMEMGYPLERTWDQWKYYGMEMGYPHLNMYTSVKT